MEATTTAAEILSMVEDIDTAVCESEIYVIEAYTDMIYKEAAEESKSKPDGIFKQISEASKSDANPLVSFLKFIPRLIAAIAKTIHDKFAKSKIGEVFSGLTSIKNGAKTRQEKHARVEELNKQFKGRCEFYYDAEKDEIKIKRSFVDVIAVAAWGSSLIILTYKLFKKIKQVIERDPNDPSELQVLINDCKALLDRNNQNKPGKLDITVDALEFISETAKTASQASAEISLLATGIQTISNNRLAKNATKRNLTTREIETDKKLTELTNYVSKIGAIIATTMGSLSFLTDWSPIVKDMNNKIKTLDAEDEIIKPRIMFKENSGALSIHGYEYYKKYRKQELKEYEEDYNEAVRRAKDKLTQAGKDPDAYISQGLIDEEYKDVFHDRVRGLLNHPQP